MHQMEIIILNLCLYCNFIWIIISTPDVEGVVKYIENIQPVSIVAEGEFSNEVKNKLFSSNYFMVSKSGGKVILAGWGLPYGRLDSLLDEDSLPEEHIKNLSSKVKSQSKFINMLSSKFAKVSSFGSDDGGVYYFWSHSANGKITREYSLYFDLAGPKVATDIGEHSDVEKSMSYKSSYAREIIINLENEEPEETVKNIAYSWGIDSEEISSNIENMTLFKW